MIVINDPLDQTHISQVAITILTWNFFGLWEKWECRRTYRRHEWKWWSLPAVTVGRPNGSIKSSLSKYLIIRQSEVFQGCIKLRSISRDEVADTACRIEGSLQNFWYDMTDNILLLIEILLFPTFLHWILEILLWTKVRLPYSHTAFLTPHIKFYFLKIWIYLVNMSRVNLAEISDTYKLLLPVIIQITS